MTIHAERLATLRLRLCVCVAAASAAGDKLTPSPTAQRLELAAGGRRAMRKSVQPLTTSRVTSWRWNAASAAAPAALRHRIRTTELRWAARVRRTSFRAKSTHRDCVYLAAAAATPRRHLHQLHQSGNDVITSRKLDRTLVSIERWRLESNRPCHTNTAVHTIIIIVIVATRCQLCSEYTLPSLSSCGRLRTDRRSSALSVPYAIPRPTFWVFHLVRKSKTVQIGEKF